MYQISTELSSETRKKGCPMRYLTFTVTFCLLQGCAVIAVADLAVTTAATVAKAGVKTVGAAVDLVTSDKSEKEREKTVKK